MSPPEPKLDALRTACIPCGMCAVLLITLTGCHKLLDLDSDVVVADGGVADGGAVEGGVDGAADGGRDAEPEGPRVLTEVAIAQVGEPCLPEDEGVRACVAHASRGRSVCDGEVWRSGGACEGDTRCQTELGVDQGVCLPIASGCGDAVGAEPFCAELQLVRSCSIDLLDVQDTACGGDEVCGQMPSGALGCVRSDDCAPDPCNGHGQCSDGVLSFSCVCEGVWGNPTCDEQVPLFQIQDVAVDVAGGRAYVLDQTLRTVVAVELASGNRVLVSGPERGEGPKLERPTSLALDPETGRAYVTDSPFGVASLFVVELSTGNRVVISDASAGSGPSFQTADHLALDVAGGHAYLLSSRPSQLFSVDLSSGEREVISGPDTGDGEELSGMSGLALDLVNDRAFVSLRSRGSLLAIDLSTGDRVPVRDQGGAGEVISFSSPRSLALDPNTLTAYVVEGDPRRVVVQPLGTGARRTLSGAGNGAGPQFGSPTEIALGARGEDLYVVDPGLEALFRVKLDGGDREIISDSSQGEGSRPFAIEDMVLGPERGVLYGWDSISDAVVSIDIATGDRTVLVADGQGEGQEIIGVVRMALDPASSRLYLTNSGRESLLAMELDSGDRRVVSDNTTGTGDVGFPEDVAAMALDVEGGRAYVQALDFPVLFSVDIASGDRSVISDAGDGVEPPFNHPVGLALDLANNRAYVMDDALLAVELESGERSVVSSTERGSGPSFQRPEALALDVEAGRAYVLDGGLLSVDLATGERVLVSGEGAGAGPELVRGFTEGDVVFDRAQGVVYVTKHSTLWAIDVATGDRLIVAN